MMAVADGGAASDLIVSGGFMWEVVFAPGDPQETQCVSFTDPAALDIGLFVATGLIALFGAGAGAAAAPILHHRRRAHRPRVSR